jgi:hypothetical protein
MNKDYLCDGSGGHPGSWGERRDGQIGEREDMSALMAEGLAAATASAEELWLVQAVVLVWRLAGAVGGLALVAEGR